MADELGDAKENLQWADENIGKLNAAFNAFFACKPYQLVTDVDVQRQKITEKIIPDQIPWHFKLMARDVVHTLRIPLDILACRLAVANGQPTDGIYYPIRQSKTAFESTGTQGAIVKQFGAAAVAWLTAQQPYFGGDNLVWAIHEIDKVDKHIELRSVHPTASPGNITIIGGSVHPGINPFVIGAEAPDPSDNSFVLISYDFRNAHTVQHQGPPTLFVAFRDVGPIEGKPVPVFLREAHTRVSAIIADAECTFFP
jgi:hypothetical protein